MKYATKHEAITDYSVINKLCKYCSFVMFIDCVAFGVNRDNRFFKAHNKNQTNK